MAGARSIINWLSGKVKRSNKSKVAKRTAVGTDSASAASKRTAETESSTAKNNAATHAATKSSSQPVITPAAGAEAVAHLRLNKNHIMSGADSKTLAPLKKSTSSSGTAPNVGEGCADLKRELSGFGNDAVLRTPLLAQIPMPDALETHPSNSLGFELDAHTSRSDRPGRVKAEKNRSNSVTNSSCIYEDVQSSNRSSIYCTSSEQDQVEDFQSARSTAFENTARSLPNAAANTKKRLPEYGWRESLHHGCRISQTNSSSYLFLPLPLSPSESLSDNFEDDSDLNFFIKSQDSEFLEKLERCEVDELKGMTLPNGSKITLPQIAALQRWKTMRIESKNNMLADSMYNDSKSSTAKRTAVQGNVSTLADVSVFEAELDLAFGIYDDIGRISLPSSLNDFQSTKSKSLK